MHLVSAILKGLRRQCEITNSILNTFTEDCSQGTTTIVAIPCNLTVILEAIKVKFHITNISQKLFKIKILPNYNYALFVVISITNSLHIFAKLYYNKQL